MIDFLNMRMFVQRTIISRCQITDKPGSVVNDHLSTSTVANTL